MYNSLFLEESVCCSEKTLSQVCLGTGSSHCLDLQNFSVLSFLIYILGNGNPQHDIWSMLAAILRASFTVFQLIIATSPWSRQRPYSKEGKTDAAKLICQGLSRWRVTECLYLPPFLVELSQKSNNLVMSMRLL